LGAIRSKAVATAATYCNTLQHAATHGVATAASRARATSASPAAALALTTISNEILNYSSPPSVELCKTFELKKGEMGAPQVKTKSLEAVGSFNGLSDEVHIHAVPMSRKAQRSGAPLHESSSTSASNYRSLTPAGSPGICREGPSQMGAMAPIFDGWQDPGSSPNDKRTRRVIPSKQTSSLRVLANARHESSLARALARVSHTMSHTLSHTSKAAIISGSLPMAVSMQMQNETQLDKGPKSPTAVSSHAEGWFGLPTTHKLNPPDQGLTPGQQRYLHHHHVALAHLQLHQNDSLVPVCVLPQHLQHMQVSPPSPTTASAASFLSQSYHNITTSNATYHRGVGAHGTGRQHIIA